MQSAQPSTVNSSCAIPVPETVRDWAAVSFSPHDRAWAEWLFREFDGARVPRALLGRPSRDGMPYPERISLSPDPADAEQVASLSDSLPKAQHLILVVSPDSGRHFLIGEHMRIFKAAGGEQRIIALVVKGDPASPAAEPGRDEDGAWLPKWLAWRLQGNQFQPAGPEEPIVIDARLGIASLSEVRVQIMATLLDVSRTELSSLGIVCRSITEFKQVPMSGCIAPGSKVESAPIPRIAAPPSDSASGVIQWLFVACSLGALAALAFLAFEPAAVTPRKDTGSSASGAASATRGPAQTRAEPPDATAPAPAADAPAVAVIALAPDPLPEFAPVPNEPGPVAPPPAHKPAIAPHSNPVTSITPPGGDQSEQLQREIEILGAKRDRLRKSADTKLTAGDGEGAMDTYLQAVEVARRIVDRNGGNAAAAVELASLQRRFGQVALNLASAAEARKAYDEGRAVLVGLRARRALPKEGGQLLAEIEAEIRSIPKD